MNYLMWILINRKTDWNGIAWTKLPLCPFPIFKNNNWWVYGYLLWFFFFIKRYKDSAKKRKRRKKSTNNSATSITLNGLTALYNAWETSNPWRISMPKEKPIKHPIIKRLIPMIFISITLHLIGFSFSSMMIHKYLLLIFT